MKKVLVVFGSHSDHDIYDQVLISIRDSGVDFDFKICSAHRTPEEIDALVKNDYAIIVAGAGLAAALPGVIASKTIRPVIGVPVGSDFQGLDALLSIAQMPPGIPVATVGVDNGKIAAEYVLKVLKNYGSVNLIGDQSNKCVLKAKSILDDFKISNSFSQKIDPKKINIEFVYFDEPIEKKDELVIYCPLLLQEDDKAEAAINLLKHSKHGLWVGLNRGENAALFAIEVMNLNNTYTAKLNEYRQRMKNKTKEQKNA